MDLSQRAEDLAVHVIGPLVVGGPVALQRPFGPKLALEIGVQRSILDNELRVNIDNARLRVARSVVAVDVLPPLDPYEWAIAAALNDLLQVTNHELSGFATRGRHKELTQATRQLCARIPPCRDLHQAVVRHSTFSRALRISRTDSEVSWWTGSSSFRGQQVPARLLAWPGLRNVRIQKHAVPLADMAAGVPIELEEYYAMLLDWLCCSPLSDLATAYRSAPPFRWSAHTVSVVATVAGSNLALRALSHATDDNRQAAEAAVVAMRRSAEVLPPGAAQNIAIQFAGWLDEAKGHWAEVG